MKKQTKKYYSPSQILKKFEDLDLKKQNKVLRKALKLALNHKAGTLDYAVANAMGYYLEDDGTYIK